MGFEQDPTIRTLTDAIHLLNQIAKHHLIAQSQYPELMEISREARRLTPELIIAIAKLKSGRAPRRADD